MFDIAKYELNETGVLTVQNPRGDGDLLGEDSNPVRITLHGPGSDRFVQAEHRRNNAAIARAQSAMRGKNVTGRSEHDASDLVQFLADCTENIENFPVDGGAKAIYSNPRLGYIRKQVIAFLDDAGNFTKPSSPN